VLTARESDFTRGDTRSCLNNNTEKSETLLSSGERPKENNGSASGPLKAPNLNILSLLTTQRQTESVHTEQKLQPVAVELLARPLR
jgi:hypothetical protein